ncbi:hypothetical protein E4U17_007267 [Claviceps sp. LM77 group G4]|nr:hypothetical protein E4U17_007267 [Claviceps sp. LM77 group G4]KAG6073711.1 hypothetical protein E4U16_004530 [Claviceps sp. LM84 group G4]KAG6084928.1 hypothetical protein E4U33_002613 [Claviceps sp. LM78 group G4]
MSIDNIDNVYNECPDHVWVAFQRLYRHMEGDWYVLLKLAYGDTLPELDGYAIMPSLIAFRMACERREADERNTTQLPLTIRDENEIDYGETVASLHDLEDPGLQDMRWEFLTVLSDFWVQIKEQPQRYEPLTMTPFDMVWRLLERQQQMTEADEGRMTRIDRLLDLLLQEEFAGLFPMVLTKEQWAQIFLAGFELEDCKILYILEMQYCFIEMPVIRLT